eukprot:c25370_g2_i1 orf=1095-2276(+)
MKLNSQEVDNMKESRYRQFFEDMESTHVQKWDTNTINNCSQSEYEQLFRDLASIDKHKPAYDNRKNSSKKFHSTYRQLFNQLASTNIQELGKDINNWMEVQRKYHQLFKDLASIDKLEYRDWINDFRMELQSNYDQLLRDLALTDRSKLVLRAISLILGSCGINVVIGVDKGMVERAIMREFLKDNGDKVLDILAKNKDIKIVSKKHEDLEEVESVDKLKTDVKETNLQKVEIDKNENKHDYTELAENYLEKIIQVPIQMPHPSKKHIERFVQGQVGDHLTRLQKAQKRKQKENMRVEDKPAKNEGSSQRQEDEVKDKGSAEIQEVIEEGSEEDHVMNEEDSQGHVKLEDGASDSIVFRSLLANYTPMEKDMFGRLCQLVTKEQRVPREWKRF